MIFLSVFRIYISAVVYMFVRMFLGLPVSIVGILPTFGCCIWLCKWSLGDVCFGDGLVIYFNYFCLWNEMFILYRIKIYLLVRVRARWGVNRWMCQSMSAKWMDVSINECEMDVSIDEYVIIVVVLVYFCGLLGVPLGVPPPYDGLGGVPPPYDGFRLGLGLGLEGGLGGGRRRRRRWRQ